MKIRYSFTKTTIISPLFFLFVLSLSYLTSCAVAPPFSQTAYDRAVALKAESLALMDKATEPFNAHQQEVVALLAKIEQAYEFENGQAFVNKTKKDLERWSQLLIQGDLSKEDFEWLVKGKKDLAELKALKQAGLAMVQMDQFRNSLIDLVVSTAFKVLLV